MEHRSSGDLSIGSAPTYPHQQQEKSRQGRSPRQASLLGRSLPIFDVIRFQHPLHEPFPGNGSGGSIADRFGR